MEIEPHHKDLIICLLSFLLFLVCCYICWFCCLSRSFAQCAEWDDGEILQQQQQLPVTIRKPPVELQALPRINPIVLNLPRNTPFRNKPILPTRQLIY